MQKYDIIIIGSGLGGLECGVILAKEGKKVLILEKNRQFGGALQIFSRDKVIIDTGVHYIGGLGNGQNLNRLFHYLGIMDSLKLKKLDEDCFDLIRFEDDSTEYKQSQGFDNYIQSLSQYFPEEEKGIRKYVSAILKIASDVPLFNLENADYNPIENPYLSINAADFIAEYVKNPKLQSVLAGSAMLYEARRNQTTAYEHALIMHSYISGSYKCVDGGAQIANLLVQQLKNEGAEIKNYAQVTAVEYVRENNWVVKTANGDEYSSSQIISNIHPTNTFGLLKNTKLRSSYQSRISTLPNSTSAFCVHLVMKPNEFRTLNYNIYSYHHQNIWDASKVSDSQWPSCYGLFDSPMSTAGEFSKLLNVMSYMSFEEVQKWSNTFRTYPEFSDKRSQEYEDFKERKVQKVMEMLELKFPSIRSNIKSMYSSSPLTFRDYLNTPEGSIYGIAKNAQNPIGTIISPKVPIPGLYFTGQNVNLHGILGVSLTSILTCSEILGRDYLLEKINKA